MPDDQIAGAVAAPAAPVMQIVQPEAAPAPAAPAPEAAPVAADPAPAPAAEAAPAPTAEVPTGPKPSLLEGASAKEAAPAAEAPAEPAPEPVAPVYQPFTLPEGVGEDAAAMERFTGLLAEHKLPQEAGQALVDLYGQEAARFAEQMRQEQVRAFETTKQGWVESIQADRDLGGARFDTTLRQAAQMRDLLIPAEHREEFNNFLTHTGAGDHPAIFRLLVNAHRLFGESSAPPPPAKPAPPPRGANGARQAGASRLRDFYQSPGR